MKKSEIITFYPIETEVAKFKDERLKKATERIISIYRDAVKYAETKNREIAKILGEVAVKKSYEADGFKSVADYASLTFGIARQNAYALANAGKIYNDKDAHPELKEMTPSKLAELSRLDSQVVKEAVEKGTINHETTQKDLREFANAHTSTAEDKVVVVQTYTANPIQPDELEEENKEYYNSNFTIDEWDEKFKAYVTSISSSDEAVEVINLPKGKVDSSATKATVTRRLYLNHKYSLVVEFYKYKPGKEKKSSDKLSKEEIDKILSEEEN